jgi:hypothetical protein
VTYTDGTTETFTFWMSDWFTPQDYLGEAEVMDMVYRDLSNGTQDDRTFYIYGYSMSLMAGKTVKSITLPNNADVKILAMTLV